MTYVELDRRVTKLEGRVSDIEYTMPRDIRGVRIYSTRLGSQMITMAHGIAAIMVHLGLEPIQIEEVRYPTDAEIDESFEADC
ncbi:hypothetical protein [Nocardia sp. XZ_19_385]|uniref:hypothetical protein n=1 Tax=Nocardia sp. XZ_19_385 TaxID=2769488 RepID=UPI001890B0F9|nr:hypothetical protein [Nocardia sp. XZ_19_385]